MNEKAFLDITGMALMSLPEVPGIFADAVVTDTHEALVFLSLWGRDTAIQELLARLSVSEREGGLEQLSLTGPEYQKVRIRTGNADRYVKISGRMPKDNLFGAVTQLWLYDRLVTEPDRVNRKAILLHRVSSLSQPLSHSMGSDEDKASRLWQRVRQTCHLPLLDHWRDTVLDAFRKEGWIQDLSGIGLNGITIDLGSDDVERVVGSLILDGRLSLLQAA
ncbi:MAG: hypothetical protein JMN27_17850 [gamma proteobacterium endosymbiont of Lamellibrachia anaximandri]|nr:hypothetical protein [gamma proteobacterium endosymbiont of Lamellibrachia anaximandri]MBL3535671.1 hypothetical protein [gamma proteobacterium endosymbiont of Lamellibrachia anaximandri]